MGRLIFQRIFGAERWNVYQRIIVAGIAAGMGIVVGISAAIVIMTKSAWILPY